METIYLIAPVILSLFILFLPGRMRFPYTLVLTLFFVAVSSVLSVRVILNPGETIFYNFISSAGSLSFCVDGISAFFILVTNFTIVTGILYARGYLSEYRKKKSPLHMALHYFAYLWLYISMLAVLTLREGTAFLVAWELMGVSSFLLILFEAEIRNTLKTAVNYLIQMHVGLVLILVGFLFVERETTVFGFDGLAEFFRNHQNMPLFLLLFAGFAIKAGFVPFHTWLPEAHPAAPSHVSGVMSGVMIKMGLFGILRVLASLQSGQVNIGVFVLVMGVITGLYGIMQSVIQSDMKKMLAWSTIENVGIIGIGLGLGTIGLGKSNHALVLLGFGGAMLHILNHSLFKSLLFYTAGSVYKATHTRNMDQLGGLVHSMPRTTTLFLAGSLAICALPPLNGFISEVLIYYGLFAGLQLNSFYLTLLMTLAILALSLIGGLAIFGFTRSLGITFLGSPRAGITVKDESVLKGMLFPEYMILLLIVTIGLAPPVFMAPLMEITGALFGVAEPAVIQLLMHALVKISLVSAILIFLVVALWYLRKAMKIEEKTITGPTWGCGYTAGTPRQQYTASSFAANFTELANPLLRTKDDFSSIPPEDLFPAVRIFRRRTIDVITRAVDRITGLTQSALRNIARLQTGHIQHYILYAFLFMFFIFGLLFLNLI